VRLHSSLRDSAGGKPPKRLTCKRPLNQGWAFARPASRRAESEIGVEPVLSHLWPTTGEPTASGRAA
jgi:hypothetical protein